MNSSGMNPVWGSYFIDDAAGYVMNDVLSNEDDATGALLVPHGDLSCSADLVDEVLNVFNTGNTDRKVVVEPEPQIPMIMKEDPQIPGSSQNNINVEEQLVKGENICLHDYDIEKKIETFDKTYMYDKYAFHVEESERQRNKPYEVEDNCIIAKRNQAIKIKVEGAHEGLVVRMHMLFKDDTHYQKPVLACRNHNNDSNPSPHSSFYVVPINPVKYEMEDGHPTAVITLSTKLRHDQSFSPVFRCWNSCNKSYGREQQMILRLCDSRTGEILHMDSFDIRVCENVGRDSQVYIKQEKKIVKRLKKGMSKKAPRKQSRNETRTVEELQEGIMDQASAVMPSPAPRMSRYYLVEMDDEMLPVLAALLKVRGKTMVEVDPASLREGSV